MATTQIAIEQVSTRQTLSVTHTVGVDGQRGYLLPFCSYVRADTDDLTVEVSTDGGNSWTTLVQGVDWRYCVRQYGHWPQKSTADVSSGAFLTSALPLGSLVRLSWASATVNALPPEPALVRVENGQIRSVDGRWLYNGPAAQNGWVLPDRQGFAIEAWRFSRNQGRARTTTLPGYVTISGGRRWVPYYRFPVAASSGNLIVDAFALPLTCGSQPTYRFCYYDPSNGARSALSAGQIRMQTRRAEGNRATPKAHLPRAAWVVR